MKGFLFAFLFLFFSIPHAVSAQNLTGQLETLLAPRDAATSDRSVQQSGQVIAPYQQIPGEFDVPRASFQVAFRPGTALLTADGITVLRDVALALNGEELAGSTFQVGAHMKSDFSVATEAQPVSQLRAQTVVEHLVAFYEIQPQRLIPVGYGQTTPVVGLDPTHPNNERIEIINVDDLVR